MVPYAAEMGLSGNLLSALQIGAFCAKAFLLDLFFILIRWTIPRFRYDQLMNLGWKFMLPLSVLNIVVTGLVIIYLQG